MDMEVSNIWVVAAGHAGNLLSIIVGPVEAVLFINQLVIKFNSEWWLGSSCLLSTRQCKAFNIANA
jgi:hypothetical protein